MASRDQDERRYLGTPGERMQRGDQRDDPPHGRRDLDYDLAAERRGYRGSDRSSTRGYPEAWGVGEDDRQWPSGRHGHQLGYGGGGSDLSLQGRGYGRNIWRDHETEGPHRGRGPRGWQRSDDHLREEACERLAESGWVDATEIDVRVEQCEITLEGTVDSRRSKRLAEDVVERVSGVRDVHNRLRIQPKEP